MTIKQALETGNDLLVKSGIGTPQLDSEILLAFALEINREYLYANPESELSELEKKKYWEFIKRRTKFEPVAYITGNKEFYNLNFFVSKDVLIPRPETELLIEEALAMISKKKKVALADIGTGSGIIAITLKKLLPNAEVFAVDKSEKALNIARFNAKNNKVKIKFYNSDLLASLKNKKVDFLIANLPYIPDSYKKTNPNQKSLSFEPKVALYGGKVGLDIYQKFFDQIEKLKYHPQSIICEIGHLHLKETKSLAKKYMPSYNFEIKKDLAGKNRILIFNRQK